MANAFIILTVSGSPAVFPHRATSAADHFVLLGGFFAVIRKESGFQSCNACGAKQFRAHCIAGVRRRSGVKAIFFGLFFQGGDGGHYRRAILLFRSEDLQESPGIHGMRGFYPERIVAIADIGHRNHPPVPHAVHPGADLKQFLLLSGGIPEGIYLVYESGHAGTPAEKSLHV